jgi:hypothetical protein
MASRILSPTRRAPVASFSSPVLDQRPRPRTIVANLSVTAPRHPPVLNPSGNATGQWVKDHENSPDVIMGIPHLDAAGEGGAQRRDGVAVGAHAVAVAVDRQDGGGV